MPLSFGENKISGLSITIPGSTDVEDALITDLLEEYTNDRVEYVGAGAFAYRKIKNVNFPICSAINNHAFYDCSSLTSISFPVCTSIGSSAFNKCNSLTSINFPVCTNIGNNAFGYCFSLTSVSFPVCTSIGSSAFNKCYNLITLILGASTVCTLSNSNAFTSTPIGGYSTSAGKYGTIYVYESISLCDNMHIERKTKS